MGNETTTVLKGLRILAEQGEIAHGYIAMKDGRITAIGDCEHLVESPGQEIITCSAADICIPGFVDGHIHGAAGADVMDATPEALDTMVRTLPHEGTTSFLATTMTQDVTAIEATLDNAGSYISEQTAAGGAEVLGIHLEGPFISAKKPGAQPIEAILPPSVSMFQNWQTLAQNGIKLVTLAPEEDEGLELIRYLVTHGVIAAVGHSDASYDQVVAAIDEGATRITHLYNGMRGLHHRDPGVAGAALLRDELLTEVIADGIHSRPEMVDFAYRMKGQHGLTMITDAMRAKCLQPGTYDLGGQDVKVEHGEARLANGSLAGSILEMNHAVRNMCNFTGCDIADVVNMASVNTARQLGVYDRKGSLAVGKDADVVVMDSEYQIKATYCRGDKV